MIVEQHQYFEKLEEGGDILAGWNELPHFILGYLRPAQPGSQRNTAVGLFHCSEGPVASGQRNISQVTIKLSSVVLGGVNETQPT